MSVCHTCTRTAQRDAGNAPLWDSILRTEYWDVVHAYNTSLPGWLVLVTRRHISAIDEMGDAESVELGRLLRRVSIALKVVTGCAKTYVIQFAEHPEHPHVHFHVVPRMAEQPAEYRGRGVFGYLNVLDEERVGEEEMNGIGAEIRALLETSA